MNDRPHKIERATDPATGFLNGHQRALARGDPPRLIQRIAPDPRGHDQQGRAVRQVCGDPIPVAKFHLTRQVLIQANRPLFGSAMAAWTQCAAAAAVMVAP